MKFSLFYKDKRQENKKIYGDVDEVIIEFHKEDTTLPKFLDAHIGQDVVIDLDFPEVTDYNFFLELYQKYPNIRYGIPYFLGDGLREYFEKNAVPHFYKYVLATNWSALKSLITMPTTDIYIGGELGFDIAAAAKRVHDAGKRVRVLPSQAQGASFTGKEDITSFFIRPEDILLYYNYIDVVEFIDPVACKAYMEEKWFGKLNEIVTGLDSNIDNRCISNIFALARMGCKKRCARNKSCEVCYSIEQMSKTLTENDLIIRERKRADGD